jgi:UDP-N-acetylglucosamine 4,6-dehydratase (inverting)
MFNFENRAVLLTGGTGSFGKAFVKTVLQRYPGIRRLVVFSRDELKQFEMSEDYPQSRFPAMRYFIGDVRDGSRLKRACEGIDTIIHAAALKQVPTAEYNPMECILTNIHGAQNVIEAALDLGVRDVVALSTDKAAAPINLYGATKLCSDKLFVAANNIKGKREIKFSVVRYGNVLGSRGSVIPYFLKKRADGVLPITDLAMTRFNISLEEGVDLVLRALDSAWGGEIFVPKIPSYSIKDVAEAIAPSCRLEVVGIRAGEKIHEEMITASDSFLTVDLGPGYVILQQTHRFTPERYCHTVGAKPVPQGFTYNSGTNTEWLSADQIRELIKRHVDPTFEPT